MRQLMIFGAFRGQRRGKIRGQATQLQHYKYFSECACSVCRMMRISFLFSFWILQRVKLWGNSSTFVIIFDSGGKRGIESFWRGTTIGEWDSLSVSTPSVSVYAHRGLFILDDGLLYLPPSPSWLNISVMRKFKRTWFSLIPSYFFGNQFSLRFEIFEFIGNWIRYTGSTWRVVLFFNRMALKSEKASKRSKFKFLSYF